MMEPEFVKELNTLIALEAARFKVEELLPTDWTVDRMAKEHGLTISQARKALNNLTEQGHFIKVKVANPNGGGAKTAYRPVEKKR